MNHDNEAQSSAGMTATATVLSGDMKTEVKLESAEASPAATAPTSPAARDPAAHDMGKMDMSTKEEPKK